MFRNLPRKYTALALTHELEGILSPDKWDFVYLPWDASTPVNMGYAFMNFVDAESAAYVQQCLDGRPWRLVCSYRAIKIVEAHVQGLQQNLLHCAHKVSPDTDPAHAPLVYHNGEQIEFQTAVRLFGRPKSAVALQQKAQLQQKKKQYKEQQEQMKQMRLQRSQRGDLDSGDAASVGGSVSGLPSAPGAAAVSPQQLARELLCPQQAQPWLDERQQGMPSASSSSQFMSQVQQPHQHFDSQFQPGQQPMQQMQRMQQPLQQMQQSMQQMQPPVQQMQQPVQHQQHQQHQQRQLHQQQQLQHQQQQQQQMQQQQMQQQLQHQQQQQQMQQQQMQQMQQQHQQQQQQQQQMQQQQMQQQQHQQQHLQHQRQQQQQQQQQQHMPQTMMPQQQQAPQHVQPPLSHGYPLPLHSGYEQATSHTAADSLWPTPAGASVDRLLEGDFNDDMGGQRGLQLPLPCFSAAGAGCRGVGSALACSSGGSPPSFRTQCNMPQALAAQPPAKADLETSSPYKTSFEKTAAQIRELLSMSGAPSMQVNPAVDVFHV